MTPRAHRLLSVLLVLALFASLLAGASLVKLAAYTACFFAFCWLVTSLERAAERHVDGEQPMALLRDRHLHPTTSGALPGERTWRDGAR